MSKFTITNNYGMMPNQIQGITDDGKYFYFRGRTGKWTLHFGETEEEATFGPGFEGQEERAGWFEKDEWEKFFWTVISTIEQGTATPLDVNRHKTEIEELVVRLTTPATTEQIQEFHALIKGEQK